MTEPEVEPLVWPRPTECGYCPWSILAWDAVDKARKEDKHRASLHAAVAPDTDEMCARMVDEHADARQVVLQAIVAVARVNDGQVDPNAVRQLLPRDLQPPQIVGAVYRMLRGDGGMDGRQLVVIGEVVNRDKRGHNEGKPTPLYRLVRLTEERSA